MLTLLLLLESFRKFIFMFLKLYHLWLIICLRKLSFLIFRVHSKSIESNLYSFSVRITNSLDVYEAFVNFVFTLGYLDCWLLKSLIKDVILLIFRAAAFEVHNFWRWLIYSSSTNFLNKDLLVCRKEAHNSCYLETHLTYILFNVKLFLDFFLCLSE